VKREPAPMSPIPEPLWTATVERDLARSLCESWSSMVVEQRIELEFERHARICLEYEIRAIVNDDNLTSGQVRARLAELIAR